MSYSLHMECIAPDHTKNIYIFCHGFGSSSCYNEFEGSHPHIISALQTFEKGCGIITFDFVGHGKSKGTTINDIYQLTPKEEINNLKEVFEYATQKYPFSKIIPICASHGALILSLFLDQYHQFISKINTIILWYPCLQYKNIFYAIHNHTILPLIPGAPQLSSHIQQKFTEKNKSS